MPLLMPKESGLFGTTSDCLLVGIIPKECILLGSKAEHILGIGMTKILNAKQTFGWFQVNIPPTNATTQDTSTTILTLNAQLFGSKHLKFPQPSPSVLVFM